MPRPEFPKPVRYGTIFHPATGKLFIFNTDEDVKVMRAWPRPQAWILTAETGWRGFHPNLFIPQGTLDARLARLERAMELPAAEPEEPLVIPGVPLRPANFTSLIREKARLEWMGTIPPEIRLAVRRFPKQQWHLLRLAAACGTAGIDLMRATPALALGLACASRFRPIQRPLRAWRTLLGPRRSQVEAAAWLGFPDTPASVRLLRKVDRTGLSAGALLYLRQIARDPRLRKRAAHLPTMTRTGIYLLSSPALEPLTGQTLLQELVEGPGFQLGRLLRDTVRMLATLHPEGARVQPFETSIQLREFHDELAARFQLLEGPDLPLTRPPFPGNDTIQPILTIGDLAVEGREMNHCVTSYLRRIQEGTVAIYRVLAPERATLSLRRHYREGWAIDDLRLAANQEPSGGTREAVRNWFSQARWDLRIQEERQWAEFTPDPPDDAEFEI